MKTLTAHAKLIAFALFFTVFIITFILVVELFTQLKIKNRSLVNLPTPTLTALPKSSPSPTPEPGKALLLIGHGGSGHPGGGLADTLLIIHTNPVTKKLNFISIPRDLWVPIPTQNGIQHYKINMAYSLETKGAQLTKEMIKAVTDINVDYFVSIDFRNFEKAIDALKGIDVNVPVSFSDEYYPVAGKESESCGKSASDIEAITATMSGFLLEKQFKCRYETLSFTKGTTHMNGLTALKFVRSRHSSQHGGDFARSERQIALVLALKDKSLSLGAWDNAVEFFKNFVGMIKSDIDPNSIPPILSLLGHPNTYKIHSINLSTDNVLQARITEDGQYALIPKDGIDSWQVIKNYIKEEMSK